jgi:hypothetical protein
MTEQEENIIDVACWLHRWTQNPLLHALIPSTCLNAFNSAVKAYKTSGEYPGSPSLGR